MYTHQFTTDYLFTKEDLTTSFVRLANYIQETSLYHSSSIGYPMEWFYENQTGFLLTSWNFEILSLPKWGDKINISTWPTKRVSKIANRSFIVKNEKDEILINADSTWVYVDLETGEPQRITDELINKYGQYQKPLIDKKIKIPKSENCSFLKVSHQVVKRFDVDSNHHVNNINYIMWALNEIPDEIYNNCKLKNVSVKYSKECKIYEPLIIQTNILKENEYLTIILNSETKEIKSSIFSIWE